MLQNEIIDQLEQDIRDTLKLFEESREIESLKKESNNVWSAALSFANKLVIAGTDKLTAGSEIRRSASFKAGQSNNNIYNLNTVNKLCNIYISLSNEYDKIISIKSFCKLSGIKENTIYRWYREYMQDGGGPGTVNKDLYLKLKEERLESLQNTATSGKRNPVGVIAVLNNEFWNDKEKQPEEQTQAIIDRQTILEQFGILSENNNELLPPKTD